MSCLSFVTALPLADSFSVYIISVLIFISIITVKKKKKPAGRNKNNVLDETVQSFLNSLDYPVFAVDKSYMYLFFNKCHSDDVKNKHNIEIAPGHCLFEHIKDETLKETAKSYIDKALKGETFKALTNLYSPGTPDNKYQSIYHSPLIDSGNNISGAVVIAYDITELVNISNSLKDIEERFRIITEQSAEIIFELNNDGKVDYISPNILNLYGINPGSVLNKHFSSVLGINQVQEADEVFNRTLADKKPSYHEFEFNSRSGLRRILQTSLTPFADINRKVKILGVSRDISERIEHERKLLEIHEKLNRLYNITKEISGTLEIEKVYKNLHDFARSAVPCDGFIVSMYDFETGLIKCSSLWGAGYRLDPGILPELQYDAVSESNQSLVIRTGKSFINNDLPGLKTEGSATYYFDEKGQKVEDVPKSVPVCNSAIFVPLKIDDKVIGIMQAFSYERNAYSEEHIELLETISTHISAALQNARLYEKSIEEIRQRKETQAELELSQKMLIDSNLRLQLLYDITRELSSTLDADSIYRLFFEAVKKAIPCDGYMVSYFDTEQRLIKCVAANAGGLWLSQENLPVIPVDEEGNGAQSRVLLTGKAAVVNDLDKYQENVKHRLYFSDSGDMISHFPDDGVRVRSGIYVPLKAKNRVTGIVVIQSTDLNVYNDEHLMLLETLSHHLASSLENAELYKKAQDEIEERKKIEETLQLTQFSVEKSTDAITWVDMSGKITDVNEAACRLFETGKSEILKKHVWDFEIKAGEDTWHEFKKRIKINGSVLDDTFILTGKNNVLPVEILANYLSFKGKEYVVAFVRDISERKRTQEELSHSEKLFRSIFENAAAGIVFCDPEGIVLHLNSTFSSMLGYEQGEIIGLNIGDLTYPEDFKIEVENLQHLLSGKTDIYRIEKRYARKDNTLLWCDVSISVIRDNENQPFTFVGIAIDISAKKQAEDMLKTSESRYRSVVSALSEGVVLYDNYGKVITFNESAYKILGLEKDEYWLRNLRDKSWKTIKENGETFKGEEYPSSISLRTGKSITDVIMGVYKPNGELRWISVNSEPLFRNNSNLPYAVVASYTDITEQKMAEEALRESEERYRGIFEQTNIGISILTLKDWRYLKVNKAYTEMLGYSEDEFMGLTIVELSHPDDYEIQKELGHIESISDFVIEKRLRKKNGDYIWVNVSSSIIRDRNHEPLFRQAIVENIDSQKKAELELKFQEEKIRSLYYLSNRPFTDENEIMKFALEEIVRITKSELGFLHIINENEVDVDKTIWSDTVYKKFDVNILSNFRIDSIEAWAQCTKVKKAVINNDIQRDLNFKFPEGHPSVTRLLSVPIYENGKLVIVVGIGNKSENYDDNDVFHLQLFSEEMWSIIIKNRKESQLEKSLKEKEIMLKEIHHRVKNNLQIISALLNLKSMSVENPEIQAILIESRDRVQSMALVHKKLYSSADFTGINFTSYVEDLSYMLLTNSNTETDVKITYDIDNFEFDINFMVPLGLIFNELLTNSFKHAFKGRVSGEIKISAHKAGSGQIVIKYGDDGIGFDESFEPESAASLGLQLIFSLTDQLQGTINVTNENGVKYEITLKEE